MKKNLWGVVLVAAMMIGLLARPAAANPAPPDVGTITGTALVGKLAPTVCQKEQAGDPIGPGLGLPLIHQTKSAYYSLRSTQVMSVGNPLSLGSLNLCGVLNPTLSAVPTDDDKPGIGASCGASKGYDGVGRIIFEAGPAVWLNHIGWKASSGGFLPVTGEANTEINKGTDDPDDANDKVKNGARGSLVLAPTIAIGGVPCLTKTGEDQNKAGGARGLSVISVWSITGMPYIDDNLPLGTCKGEDALPEGDPIAEACLWEEKRRG